MVRLIHPDRTMHETLFWAVKSLRAHLNTAWPWWFAPENRTIPHAPRPRQSLTTYNDGIPLDRLH
jgi:hypothetical protein